MGGQENVENSKWLNFELRTYNADLGRFNIPDPMGQFASPYVGMGNNPINGVDPTGGLVNNYGYFDIVGASREMQFRGLGNTPIHTEMLSAAYSNWDMYYGEDYFGFMDHSRFFGGNGSGGGAGDGWGLNSYQREVVAKYTDLMEHGAKTYFDVVKGKEVLETFTNLEDAKAAKAFYEAREKDNTIKLPEVNIKDADQIHDVVQFTLDNLDRFANTDLSGNTWSTLYNAAQAAQGRWSNGSTGGGAWQLGVAGGAAAGVVGVSFEAGIAFDFNNGFHIAPYFTLSEACGVDLSIGGKLTYSKPTNSNINMGVHSLRGWGEAYNGALWIFDGSYGGDSMFPGLDPNNFSNSHLNYESYGFGVSAGLPIGFTKSKGYTWVY